MPELPEVEVVRRDLDPVLRGRVVVDVEIARARAVRREADEDAFVQRLRGRRVVSTDRVGKFLVVRLDGPDARDVVLVHLGMSGQWRIADAAAPRPAHTHVVWSLDDGRALWFVDPRTFGQMWHGRSDEPGGRPRPLAHLGPDALDDLSDATVLAARLAKRRIAVKLRLMDQTAVAGLGNIYTDEVLFHARIAPQRPAGSLTPVEVDALLHAIHTVLPAAIEARGSSLADAQYVDGRGRSGQYQRQHAVHARAGGACPRCGGTVARLRMGDRFASWCPECQR